MMRKLEPPNRAEKVLEAALFLLMAAGLAMALESYGYRHAVWAGDATLAIGLMLMTLTTAFVFGRRLARSRIVLAVVGAILVIALFDRLNLSFLHWLRLTRAPEVSGAGFETFRDTYTHVLAPVTLVAGAAITMAVMFLRRRA